MAVFATPILDNFNRANESPLSGGGNWAQLGTNQPLVLVSNKAEKTANTPNAWASYWTNALVSPGDMEVYATIATSPLGTNDQYGVCARVINPGSATLARGYEFHFSRSASSWFAEIWRMGSGFNGEFTLISVGPPPPNGANPVPGDKVGIRVFGDPPMIEGWWYDTGGGTGWRRVMAATDRDSSRIPAGPAYCGIRMAFLATPIQMDDFGGGVITAPTSTINSDGYHNYTSGKRDLNASSGSKRTPGGRIVVPEPKQLARLSVTSGWWTAGPRQVAGQTWPRPS